MTVIERGDATEIETVLNVVHAVPGPVYVRMLRGEVPRLFDAAEPMRLGKLRTVVDDQPSGKVDVAVFSSGICTEEAMRATLARRGAASRSAICTSPRTSRSTQPPSSRPPPARNAE